MERQERQGVIEFRQVLGVFEVQVDGRPVFCDRLGQGRLADLAWAKQRYCRGSLQRLIQYLGDPPFYQPCILGVYLLICKVYLALGT